MTIGLKEFAIFAVGVAAGLYAAKLYARAQVNGGIHSALSSVGLGGGQLEQFVQGLVTPAVVG